MRNNAKNEMFAGAPDFKHDDECPSVMLTGHVGMEAAALLAFEKGEELSAYFHPDIVRNAKLFKDESDTSAMEQTVHGAAPALVIPLSSGGLFEALWRVTEGLGMGMEIDLKAVPIRQETVEICEYFSLDPYELPSKGALLIVTQYERKIRRAFEKAGTPVSVIGCLDKGNDRILKHGEVRSFLNRPAPDRLSDILKKGGASCR